MAPRLQNSLTSTIQALLPYLAWLTVHPPTYEVHASLDASTNSPVGEPPKFSFSRRISEPFGTGLSVAISRALNVSGSFSARLRYDLLDDALPISAHSLNHCR